MYVLNWNPESRTLEASLGGHFTKAEATCFLDEFNEFLVARPNGPIEVVLDFALVKNMDDGLFAAIGSARDMARFSGATCVTFVTHDEDEMATLLSDRLQEVLEGSERYVAYRLSA